jgi:hypothetical protein
VHSSRLKARLIAAFYPHDWPSRQVHRPTNLEIKMKLLTVTSSHGGSGAVREIARFDLQLSDDVRLYGLRLMQTPERRHLTYAPSSGGRRFATFALSLVDDITAAAISALNNMGHVTANGIAHR